MHKVLGPAAPDQPEARRKGIGVVQAVDQLVAGQRLGPDGAGGGKLHEGNGAVTEIGNVAERENPAKYMKS